MCRTLCLLAKPAALFCHGLLSSHRLLVLLRSKDPLNHQKPSWEDASLSARPHVAASNPLRSLVAGVALTQSQKLPAELRTPFPHPACSSASLSTLMETFS